MKPLGANNIDRTLNSAAAIATAIGSPSIFDTGDHPGNNSGRLRGGRFEGFGNHLSGQLLHHFTRILLLLVIPFFNYLGKDITRAFLVAHVDICSRQIKLGCALVCA